MNEGFSAETAAAKLQRKNADWPYFKQHLNVSLFPSKFACLLAVYDYLQTPNTNLFSYLTLIFLFFIFYFFGRLALTTGICAKVVCELIDPKTSTLKAFLSLMTFGNNIILKKLALTSRASPCDVIENTSLSRPATTPPPSQLITPPTASSAQSLSFCGRLQTED